MPPWRPDGARAPTHATLRESHGHHGRRLVHSSSTSWRGQQGVEIHGLNDANQEDATML